MTETTEKKKAKVYFYEPCVAQGFNSGWHTSNISLNADDLAGIDAAGTPYDGKKFVVGIANTDLDGMTLDELKAFFKDRWGFENLNALYAQFAAYAFTKPNYKSLCKDLIDKGDFSTAHVEAQKAIDEYKFGAPRVATPKVTKVQVQQLSQLEQLAQSLGVSVDDMIAQIKADPSKFA